MSAIFQPPHRSDPEPPMSDHGDNHVTGMDGPEKEVPERKEEPPKRDEDEKPVEEQHDAGHGDIHPANEVWK